MTKAFTVNCLRECREVNHYMKKEVLFSTYPIKNPTKEPRHLLIAFYFPTAETKYSSIYFDLKMHYCLLSNKPDSGTRNSNYSKFILKSPFFWCGVGFFFERLKALILKSLFERNVTRCWPCSWAQIESALTFLCLALKDSEVSPRTPHKSFGKGILCHSCNSFSKKRKWKERFHVQGSEAFDHLMNIGSSTWASSFSGQTKRVPAAQAGPRFPPEQNLWRPHSVTAWERPTSAGLRCPLCPLIFHLNPSQSTRSGGFCVAHPHGQRGAGQEQNAGDRSPKSPVTPFSGQFHMTCLVL